MASLRFARQRPGTPPVALVLVAVISLFIGWLAGARPWPGTGYAASGSSAKQHGSTEVGLCRLLLCHVSLGHLMLSHGAEGVLWVSRSHARKQRAQVACRQHAPCCRPWRAPPPRLHLPSVPSVLPRCRGKRPPAERNP